jgi:hypothetical protein
VGWALALAHRSALAAFGQEKTAAIGLDSSATEPLPGSADDAWSITLENQKAGTSDWQIKNPATNHEIEGYAEYVSVNGGEPIRLFVSSPNNANFQLRVFRVGWYGGVGGREVVAPLSLPGRRQAIPQPDGDGMIECTWSPATLLDTTGWPTGVYLAKLQATGGKESYIPFVVRDDSRPSDLLFQTSVNTYQAYNNWGGKSLYFPPTQAAHKVSFNRPYVRNHGAGDFLFWEIHRLRFLEREGYDVSYTTDADTHARGHLLVLHRAFLSVGHDEYWSWEMRRNVEQARDRGVHLEFFGANACFWQVRFEISPMTGQPDRTMVCYKADAYTQDPLYRDPLRSYLTTTEWRAAPVNDPEETMIGGMYFDGPPVNGDVVVFDETHELLKGTGLRNGDRLPGMLGYEADRTFGSQPQNAEIIMSTPCSGFAGTLVQATMTMYKTARGAYVVHWGAMNWSWGHDAYPVVPSNDAIGETAGWRAGLMNEKVQIITRNILNRFGAVSLP